MLKKLFSTPKAPVFAVIGGGSIGQLVFHTIKKNSISPVMFVDTRLPDSGDYKIKIYKRANSNSPNNPFLNSAFYVPKPYVKEADVVIVTVKAWNARKVLESVKKYLNPNTPILLLMNGMGIYEEIQKVIHNPIWLATTARGAEHKGTTVYPHGNGFTFIGTPVISIQINLLNYTAKAINAVRVNNIKALLLKKLMINAVINPLTALYQCKNGELLTEHKEEALKVLAEILPTLQKLGFQDTYEKALESLTEVSQKTANNFSSMASDFKLRRPSELEYILGFIVRNAVEFQHSLPFTTDLYKKLKEQA